MTVAIRQQIVDAIDTRLRTILTSGGYETSIGASVKWWESPDIDPDLLPALCCRDIDRQSWAGIGEHLHELDIHLEVYLKQSRTAWTATNHTAGQVRLYTDNKAYLCILNTTTNQAPTNATYWKEVSVTHEAAMTLRKVMADLVKCIGVDVTWGGLAQDTRPVNEERATIEQQEHCFVAVGIFFTVEFITSPWDPYT